MVKGLEPVPVADGFVEWSVGISECCGWLSCVRYLQWNDGSSGIRVQSVWLIGKRLASLAMEVAHWRSC